MVKFTPKKISFSLIFFRKTRNNILFKEKNHNNAKIPRQIKTVADGTSIYKSRPTPSWSPVHMAQVCFLTLVMEVNN
jgi:hypothetical protein